MPDEKWNVNYYLLSIGKALFFAIQGHGLSDFPSPHPCSNFICIEVQSLHVSECWHFYGLLPKFHHALASLNLSASSPTILTYTLCSINTNLLQFFMHSYAVYYSLWLGSLETTSDRNSCVSDLLSDCSQGKPGMEWEKQTKIGKEARPRCEFSRFSGEFWSINYTTEVFYFEVRGPAFHVSVLVHHWLWSFLERA